MATRTVSVLLTGTVTPYVSAMRSAARTTTTTARAIEGEMRRAATATSTAMTAAARAAEAQAARAGTSIQRTATRAAAEVSRLGARGSAALSSIGTSASAAATSLGARFPAATTRVGTALSSLGARASAAFSIASSAATTAAGVVSSRWSTASAVVSARWAPVSAVISGAMTSAGAIASSAAAAVSARWSAAGAAVSARWAAAGAAVSGAMAAASASAGSAAAFVASRWAAAGAAVSSAFGAMRLAAFAAGASVLGVANGAKKALEAGKKASLGLVAAFILAAAAAARFEKSMSEVRAVTGGSASDMKKLSQAALEAGQATIYSATQAANAEAELARAGISTADIIGGALKGSLALAASGQLELGESAIISAQAMNAFKLTGKDVGHIADVISAGAGKSATNVHHMGMAFRQTALLANQTGLSLEDTVGTLSLFAQNALTGSDAGTSLKVMLQRLVPQSNEAQAAMDAVGFSAYDASGNFIGLSALAGQMKTSFSKLTPEARNSAMATIFGSDAVRAATILYEAGSEGIDSWVSSVNDAGYATRVAATMTDNLSGDLERLQGALETALISSGSSGNKVLREMAQALTSVVNWYSQLSPSVQSSVTVIAGLVGIVGFLGTSLLLMLPRIMAVRAELVALGVTATAVRGALLALGRATVVIAVIAALAAAANYLSERMRGAPPNVDRMTVSLLELGRTGKVTGEALATFGVNLSQFGEAAARIAHTGTLDRIGDSLYEITHLGIGEDTGLEQARAQLTALDKALTSMVQNGAVDQAADSFTRFAAEAEKNGTSAEKLRTLLPGYTKALDANSAQTQLAASSQKKLGDSASMTADQIEDTRSAAEKLTDALAALNGVAISAAEKEIGFRQSLAELTETVKENGRSLDVTSEKGRKVKGAFLDAASAALSHAEAVAKQQDSIEAGNAVLEQDILLLRRKMEQDGFSKQAIEGLIGAYARIPSKVATDVTAPGARQATAEMEALKVKIAATPAGKTVVVQAPTAGAIGELEKLGYKVKTLPDGRVEITVPTANAIGALNGLQARINSMHGTQLDIVTHYKTTGSPYAPSGGRALREAGGGYIRGYASGGSIAGFPGGGEVFGPGTPTSDSVPAWLSTGEYVIRAASVRKLGLAAMAEINAGRMPGYTARPAGRFDSGSGGGGAVQQVTKHYTINLYGAKQSSAEQAAEIQRHLAFAT